MRLRPAALHLRSSSSPAASRPVWKGRGDTSCSARTSSSEHPASRPTGTAPAPTAPVPSAEGTRARDPRLQVHPRAPTDEFWMHFLTLLRIKKKKKIISPRTCEMGAPLSNASGAPKTPSKARPAAAEGGELTCRAAARRGAGPQGAEQQEAQGRGRRRPHAAAVPVPAAPAPPLTSCSCPAAGARARPLPRLPRPSCRRLELQRAPRPPQYCIVLRGRFRWRG